MEIVLTDAIARFNRFIGKDVFFLTGTDEHGQKIQEIAENEGITYRNSTLIRLRDKLRILPICLISAMINLSVQPTIITLRLFSRFFKKLYDQGDIYKSEYEGWYCTPCESFWTETQLVDGKCPDCGREVKKAKEEAYFFKMSKYQDKLMEYIESHPEFIQPESRKNEMVNNFPKAGIAGFVRVKNKLYMGIPVEFDPGHIGVRVD